MPNNDKNNFFIAGFTAILSLFMAFNGYELKEASSSMVQVQREILYVERNVGQLDIQMDHIYQINNERRPTSC